MYVVDFWIILEGKPMEEMSLSDKIKLLLFNPYTLALLFIVMLIAIGFENHSLTVKCFFLIAFYPILCELAYASWGERIGFFIILLMAIGAASGL